MPPKFTTQFANEGAFIPHQTLVTPNASRNPVFPWGAPMIQTPPTIDASNPEDTQGQVPTGTPDNEDE